MAMKKGTVTPSKAKSKEKEGPRPASKADSSRTKAEPTRSTQRV